jgi:hypothetical protein
MRLAIRQISGLSVFLFSGLPLIAQVPPPEQASSPPAAAQAMPQKSHPTTYGTAIVSYIQVPAAEFLVYDSSCGYLTDDGGQGSRWSEGIGCPFVAGLHLPAGAKPIYLELDFLDNTNTGEVFGSLLECSYLGLNCTSHPAAGAGPSDCLSPGYICSGRAFNSGFGEQAADLTPDGITVDNFQKSYRLDASAGSDGSTKIAGMIVGYVLQVSPAPLTPTFNDVPTSSPQFQFVEALVAAGITAGCGGGNYCPSNPVTRGQMAVFLAKALGLQWH